MNNEKEHLEIPYNDFLDGDSFENDQKYFEQIPGFLEKLDKASASPRDEWVSAKEAGWNV